MKAAGVLFLTPQDDVLLLQRSGKGDHPGEWCIPGGGIEDGETPEGAAMRECLEETGYLPYGELKKLDQRTSDEGVDFTTFIYRAPHMFTPKLNDEHSDAAWYQIDDLEDLDLHPGLLAVLEDYAGIDQDKPAQDDADFNEEDHPRQKDGKFGSKGAGGSSKSGESETLADVKKHADKIAKFHEQYADVLKPKEGKGGLPFYHGTSAKARESILAEGLKPHGGPGADEFAKQMHMPVYKYSIGGRAASVYITQSLTFAKQFAMMAAKATDSTPVIMKVTLPKDQEGHLKPDEMMCSGIDLFCEMQTRAFRFEGSIPPEWISKEPTEELTEDAAGKTIYIVVLTRDDEEEQTEDMTPEEWQGLRHGLNKFLDEEEAEPEHADDADFKEEDHPRDKDGKFGSGGGGSKAGKASEPKKSEKSTSEQLGEAAERAEFNLNSFEDAFKEEFKEEKHVNRKVRERAEHIAIHKLLKGKIDDDEIEQVFQHMEDAAKEEERRAKAAEEKGIVSKLKDALHSEHAARELGKVAGSFLGEHAVGLTHHVLQKEVVMASATAALVQILPQVGIHSHSATMVSTALAAYVIKETMTRTGLNARNAHKLVLATAKASLDIYRAAKTSKAPEPLGGGHPIPAGYHMHVDDEAPKKDDLEEKLEQTIKILESEELKEMLKDEKSKNGKQAKDAEDPDEAMGVGVDDTHDGPWMSCMSKDGQVMYRNKNVPREAMIGEALVDVNDLLLHHEAPEWHEIQELLAEFKKENEREPNRDEREKLYDKAHNSAGTPSERRRAKQLNVDWSEWSAWCRGQETKLEKGPFKNEPKDADVRESHRHGDLEITEDRGPVKFNGPHHSFRFRKKGDPSWRHNTADYDTKEDAHEAIRFNQSSSPDYEFEYVYDEVANDAYTSCRGAEVKKVGDHYEVHTLKGPEHFRTLDEACEYVEYLHGHGLLARLGLTRDEANFKEDDHPRDKGGKFSTVGGGGGSAKEQPKKADPSLHYKGNRSAAPLNEKYSKEAKLRNGVIRTSSVDDAVLALHEDRAVELDQPHQVSVLLDKLATEAKRMIAGGEKEPVFNLCNVSVKGTNLFCAEAHGIPRIKMPQIEDADAFESYLKDGGYKVEEAKEDASYLRPTQNELNGAQVAGLAKIFENGGRKPYTVLVSKDNYIVDGHHRWAAEIGVEYSSGKPVEVNVARVNAGIIELLHQANVFTKGEGKVGVGQRQKLENSKDSAEAIDDFEESKHPRGQPANKGQFASGSGGGGGASKAAAPKSGGAEKKQATPVYKEGGKGERLEQAAEAGEKAAPTAGAPEAAAASSQSAPVSHAQKRSELDAFLKGKLSDADHAQALAMFDAEEKQAQAKEQEKQEPEQKPEEQEQKPDQQAQKQQQKRIHEKLKSPEARKAMANSIAKATKKQLTEHGFGVAHHVGMGTIVPIVSGALTAVLPYLGMSGGHTAAAVVGASLVGYAAKQIVTKGIGFTPQNIQKFLTSAVGDIAQSFSHGSSRRLRADLANVLHGDAIEGQEDQEDQNGDDEVVQALINFIEIIKHSDINELIKNAQAPEEEENQDDPDEQADVDAPEKLEELKRTESDDSFVGDSALAYDAVERFAIDKKSLSVRHVDPDGRLRVKVTNISKANICPYIGREIPNAEDMGLDLNKIYYLLRDPKELKKAAPTFNGIQLLRKHTPVSADDPKQYDVIGCSGTDAEFVDPYLRNSLIVWTADAIESIENGEQRELSCAYRYTADMTPGTYKGEHYDGVMRNIVGNHIAAVEEGRAGSDVCVADSVIGNKEAWQRLEQELLEFVY